MDSKFPTLTNMGINNPNQINRYSLQEAGEFDVLRIVYKREKNSLLPGSKKFKFRRTTKVTSQGSSGQLETRTEISPTLNAAMLELGTIVDKKSDREEKKAIINDEMHRLEEEMNSRLAYLKSLIKELD